MEHFTAIIIIILIGIISFSTSLASIILVVYKSIFSKKNDFHSEQNLFLKYKVNYFSFENVVLFDDAKKCICKNA